jgi:predicted acetyltransferase
VKLETRHATPEDLPAIGVADGRAFGLHYTDTDLDDFRPLFEPDRFLLATEPDGGPIVGVTGAFSFDLTLPGAAPLPTQGVTWVSCATTHRRNGVVRGLLVEQHREFAERGYAVSVLTASEGGIYGRFGYGQAGRRRAVRIDRRLASFRSDAPDPGGVRFASPEDVRRLAPDVHRRWAARTPGAVSRDDRWWEYSLADRAEYRNGGTALFHLTHPDGYVSYRVHEESATCRVVDFFAATDEAHAALWRTLLGIDLVRYVSSEDCPVDDPLPWLLEDPRQVTTTELVDGLWARVLDVAAALAARRYAVEVDVVLDVSDALLGLGGRFRLRGGPDGASCERVTAEPDAHLAIGTLGSLLFGVHRAQTMARAGLIAADVPVLRRLDAAFAGDREVRNGTHF